MYERRNWITSHFCYNCVCKFEHHTGILCFYLTTFTATDTTQCAEDGMLNLEVQWNLAVSGQVIK